MVSIIPSAIEYRTLAIFGVDIGETILNAIRAILDYTVWRILYYIEGLVCFFLSLIEQIMMIFTGERNVYYQGDEKPLINVFFEHSAIRNIYGGIAMIGIVFAFAFTIIAVIRKVLDLRDKNQGMTLGIILRNLLKSILLIFSMTAILMISLETTNVLMQQVSYAVTLAQSDNIGPDEIYFDESDYAAMARMLNTLGNYSVNPSYRSRYNVNACYNDLRSDMQILGRKGIWTFYYSGKDKEGNERKPSWQSLLQPIAAAHDYSYEVPLDSYNDAIQESILNAMDAMKTNNRIYPLSHFERDEIAMTSEFSVPLDRVLFLAATMGTYNGEAAARNATYNKSPSMNDALRYPYYIGEKSIYNYDQVRKDFNPSPLSTNYIVVYLGGLGILMEMLTIILTCGVRIFNLLAMYIASPLVISVIPLDDGGKFKQWTTAFIVQLLGVVGMVLSLRLFMMFLPVIWSPDLVISDVTFFGSIITIFFKLVLTYLALEGVGKVNGIFTGILADSAGWQAITAGSMREKSEGSAIGRGIGKMMGYDKMKGESKGGGGGGGGGGDRNTLDDKIKENDKNRKFSRNVKRMEQDLAFAKQHGRHNSANGGGKVDAKGIKAMEDTLRHYKEGKGNTSVGQAKSLAYNDAVNDQRDRKQEARDRQANLKDPPMARPVGGGDDGDLPDRE